MTRGILPSPLAPTKLLPYRLIEIPKRHAKLPEMEEVLAELYQQGYRIIGCGEWFLILELRQ